MLSIEKNISPLVEQQFPGFYREEGQLFITFVKAYYEWLENNLQELVFETQTGFDVGDTITQGETTGTIIAKFGDRYIIQLSEFDAFRCNTFCNDLTPATSSSGSVSAILEERKYNALFYARRLAEIRDIDNTLDSFILQFKKKYLPNIQFTTASNKELFIKNSLDFYRAKGTERAVDLFFKLIHGFEAKIYYPGDDLFRPSDNEWVNVRYLELENADTNISMVGQIVHGAISGANAFAERLVRVKKEGRFINVLYISNLNGNFQTGENVFTKDLATNVTAKMYGSLSSFEILVSDDGFEVGEDLFIEDGRGKRGQGRVREVRTFIGTVDFELLEGGWGYSSDLSVIGSDLVLQVENIVNENTQFYYLNTPFKHDELVRQDLVRLRFDANNENTIDTGEVVVTYDSSNNEIVDGTVVFANSTQMVFTYDSSTANSQLFSSIDTVTNNTDIIQVANAENRTAEARVLDTNANSTITYTSANDSRLRNGDVLYQKAVINDVERKVANGAVLRTFFEPPTTFINFSADVGTFRTDRPFYRESDDEEFSIVSISNTNLGVIGPDNTFYSGGKVYGVDSGTVADLTGAFSFEEKAEFIVTEFEEAFTIPDFKNEQIINIIDVDNMPIDSNTYTLNANSDITDGSFGYNDIIGEFTTFSNVTISSVARIIETGPGSGYPVDPFYVIKDIPITYLGRYDFEINYLDPDKNFDVGEIILGRDSGARARIFYHDRDNQVIRATRIDLADDLSRTKDFIRGEEITGQSTNISSEIYSAYELRRERRVGENADVLARAQSGPGFVTRLDVLDSGFGYDDEERVVLRSYRDPSKEVTAIARLGKQGIGQGYHLNRRSFLSSDKYIQDNDFYQEYSYEVLTSLPFQSYRDTLIKVLHVAGTKPFGSYVSTTETNIDISLESSTEIEIRDE